MKRLFKIALPLFIIVAAVLIARSMIVNRDEAERVAPRAPAPLVQVIDVEPTRYQVTIRSRGVVRARTEGNLQPQVSGTIVEIGKNFRDGAFFEAGDLLVRIDPRDYRAAVTIAESELAQAELGLSQEMARSEQARRDLERLALEGEPSDLATRKPQLAGAKATVAAATARLAQARLNLERSTIRAPYTGRVLEQNFDVGQTVSPGMVIGQIYAIDYVEIRLPLSDWQAAQIDLPNRYRGAGNPAEPAEGTTVTLAATVGGKRHQWQGRIVRSAGSIDSASRQTFVIAQVDDPYAPSDDGRPPLQVGQFVEADIAGRTLDDVFVLPRAALRVNDSLYVVNAQDRLAIRQPAVVWRDVEEVVITDGLGAGDRVITSELALAAEGMSVRIAGETPREERP